VDSTEDEGEAGEEGETFAEELNLALPTEDTAMERELHARRHMVNNYSIFNPNQQEG